MRAQIIEDFGGVDQFKLVDHPKPAAGPGQVLIKQQASSVNPVDYKIRGGGREIAPDFPAILGADISGMVESVGEDVTGFKPGDAVYGAAAGVKGQGGAYAEYVVAEARLLAHRPKNLSPLEAAALPLVTITAWEGLERAGVKAGSTVLVRGGIGGVGHIVIQLAKAWGATVTATASNQAKANKARQLGADHIINYREQDWNAAVAEITQGVGFDVVYDATGGDDLTPAFTATRLNGQTVAIVGLFKQDLSELHARGLSLHLVFMLLPMLAGIGDTDHQAILNGATTLVEAGQLKPLIDPSNFTLDTLADAHRHAEDGRPNGKVVISIAE
ncbi:MAG: zinc-dependent alcohol dehydrogenase family protein [Pseudomonadota bacterium]